MTILIIEGYLICWRVRGFIYSCDEGWEDFTAVMKSERIYLQLWWVRGFTIQLWWGVRIYLQMWCGEDLLTAVMRDERIYFTAVMRSERIYLQLWWEDLLYSCDEERIYFTAVMRGERIYLQLWWGVRFSYIYVTRGDRNI